MKPRELAVYVQICDRTLARGNACSSDPVAIDASLGAGDAMDKGQADVAERYADHNGFDYAAMSAAVKTRHITAVTGL